MPSHATGAFFGKIGQRLFLPVDAALEPDLTAAEADRLFPDAITVLHPSLGVWALDQELPVASYLAPLRFAPADWSRAQEGPEWNEQLAGIRLSPPESWQEVFGDESQDIGSDPIKHLPKKSGEKSLPGSLGKWMDGMAGKLSDLASSAGSKLGGSGAGAAGSWFASQFERISRGLDEARHRELHRLLDALKNNPEEGLRHAIPLAQGGAHRGRSPSGGALGNRNPIFNLANLGGGGPADFWNISGELQQRLREQYLALAAREAQAGRHRRAAYIYADLLGDLRSAALALKQGGFWREAAILYKEHLHDSLAAAECYARAMLLVEAAQLYEEHGKHVEAARLYATLGSQEKAEAAFRRGVEQYRSAGDYLAAAALLEKELGCREEAIETLMSGWPASRQAWGCAKQMTEIFAIGAEHERTAGFLRKVRDEPGLFHSGWMIGSVEFLAGLRASYPDHQIRRLAADSALVKISRRLAQTQGQEARSLLQILPQLAPEDQLLARDCRRFLARTAELTRARHKRSTDLRAETTKPHIVRLFRLPEGVKWRRFRSAGLCLFAAGVAEQNGRREIVLARSLWEDGHTQELRWPLEGEQPPAWLLDVDPSHPYLVVLVAAFNAGLCPARLFPVDDAFPQRFSEGGRMSWLPDSLIAIAARRGVLAALRGAQTVDLHTFERNGTLLAVRECPVEPSGWPASIAILRQTVAVSAGRRTVLFEGDNQTVIDESAAIRELIPMPEHARAGYVAVTDEAVELRWLGFDDIVLADDTAQPEVAVTRDGLVVVVDSQQGRIYDADTRGTQNVQRFDWPGKPVQGVVSGAERGEFAIIDTDGVVHLFRSQK